MNFLQNLLPGYKTYLYAILLALVPHVSSIADNFIATHTGLAAGLAAAGVAFLRVITKPK